MRNLKRQAVAWMSSVSYKLQSSGCFSCSMITFWFLGDIFFRRAKTLCLKNELYTWMTQTWLNVERVFLTEFQKILSGQPIFLVLPKWGKIRLTNSILSTASLKAVEDGCCDLGGLFPLQCQGLGFAILPWGFSISAWLFLTLQNEEDELFNIQEAPAVFSPVAEPPSPMGFTTEIGF